MTQNIKINNKKRIETGSIKFNDDWNGLFIRGDHCIQLKFIFEKIIEGNQLSEFDLLYIKTYLAIIDYEVIGEK